MKAFQHALDSLALSTGECDNRMSPFREGHGSKVFGVTPPVDHSLVQVQCWPPCSVQGTSKVMIWGAHHIYKSWILREVVGVIWIRNALPRCLAYMDVSDYHSKSKGDAHRLGAGFGNKTPLIVDFWYFFQAHPLRHERALPHIPFGRQSCLGTSCSHPWGEN